MSTKRPEDSLPPELYYDEKEARKYSKNSRMIAVQAELAQRALDLLGLRERSEEEPPRILLDIGCGSGLSGEVLSQNGHEWIGTDISRHMLHAAKDENECEGELILHDMGLGLPFKPGVFDGAISISAIQWLCHSNSKEEDPVRRLHIFFQSLYACLARGARAVFQFYPETHKQSELICQQAMRAGFNGGLVVDFPNSTKARKVFLVVTAGGKAAPLPKPLLEGHSHPLNGGGEEEDGDAEDHVRYDGGTARHNFWKKKSKRERLVKGSRAYIEAKRERHIRQGREVRLSSRYTGRRRRH